MTSEVANLVHVIDVATRKVIRNIQVGNRPRRLLLVRDGKELWVSNELSASVSVIRTDTFEVAQTIAFAPRGFRAEDVTPVGMAASGDGTRAYIGLGRANHVAVVEVASRRVQDYVLVGRRAWGLALSRDNARLYVANGLSDDVSVVDTASRKAVATLKAGRVPHSVAIDD
ncbi:Lactonase, 7-bladed beta-propeller [compost metagenome]